MKRLKRAQHAITLVAVPIACFIGGYTQGELQRMALPFWLTLMLILFVTIVAFIILQYAGVWLLSIRRVRHSVLRGQDIEGTWMDIVRRNDRVTNIGVLHFGVDGTDLTVSGKNYTEAGTVQNAFVASMVKFEWPRLEFCFSSDQETTGSPTSSGIAVLTFSSYRDTALRYSGFCLNFSGQRGNCDGWRVLEADVLARLSEPTATRELILATVQEESGKMANQAVAMVGSAELSSLKGSSG